MRVTPASLDALATFYDMLETEPAGEHSVYVCTNISCSLRGADELYEAVREATEADRAITVRAFECLGACDIAPMASVDGVYVGPLTRRGRPAAAAGCARRRTRPQRTSSWPRGSPRTQARTRASSRRIRPQDPER